MIKVCSLVCCRGLLFKRFKEVSRELEVHIVVLSVHCIWKAPERLSSLKSLIESWFCFRFRRLAQLDLIQSLLTLSFRFQGKCMIRVFLSGLWKNVLFMMNSMREKSRNEIL
jgi:hypothetical protein